MNIINDVERSQNHGVCPLLPSGVVVKLRIGLVLELAAQKPGMCPLNKNHGIRGSDASNISKKMREIA